MPSSSPWHESGFLLGLVHDVGRLAVLAFASVASERPSLGNRIGDVAVEGAMESLHAELGGLLVLAWGFPELIVDAVRHHHRPRANGGADNPPTWGLYAADTLANLHERGWKPGVCQENDARVRELLEPLGFDLERCDRLLVELQGGLTALAALR